MFKFSITATNFHWINGKEDDEKDLCLHGHTVVEIGDELFEYDATISATALYLLKSLKEDHIINKEIQMLPCCGNTILLKNDNSNDVFIMGCDNGIDWSIIHQKENVKIITSSGNETIIPIKEYTNEVYKFADLIEDYYKKCKNKILPKNKFDRDGYIAFWNEWHRRRNSL